MYQLLKQEGNARRGVFCTVHGDVQMPAFMNVGTAAAIKGGISSYDLVDLKCQVEALQHLSSASPARRRDLIQGAWRAASHLRDGTGRS